MIALTGLLFVAGSIGCMSTPEYGCLVFGIGLLLFGAARWAETMIHPITGGDEDGEG